MPSTGREAFPLAALHDAACQGKEEVTGKQGACAAIALSAPKMIKWTSFLSSSVLRVCIVAAHAERVMNAALSRPWALLAQSIHSNGTVTWLFGCYATCTELMIKKARLKTSSGDGSNRLLRPRSQALQSPMGLGGPTHSPMPLC